MRHLSAKRNSLTPNYCCILQSSQVTNDCKDIIHYLYSLLGCTGSSLLELNIDFLAYILNQQSFLHLYYIVLSNFYLILKNYFTYGFYIYFYIFSLYLLIHSRTYFLFCIDYGSENYYCYLFSTIIDFLFYFYSYPELFLLFISFYPELLSMQPGSPFWLLAPILKLFIWKFSNFQDTKFIKNSLSQHIQTFIKFFINYFQLNQVKIQQINIIYKFICKLQTHTLLQNFVEYILFENFLYQFTNFQNQHTKMQQKLAYLLDRSQPFTAQKVQLLDQLTNSMKINAPDAKEAHQIWRLLKEDHYFWYNSSQILQESQIDETKVYILVILEEAIKQKWYALQQEQREGIKNYIVNLVIDYGAVENLQKSRHNILSKANSTLVQIVKYEWNTTWKSFISDICSASVKDMNICQNNFQILKILSEEIFDYSKNQMTQKQIADLKQQMNTDFTTIFQLCKLILENAHQAKPSLVNACLQTLNAFLSWIPMYYIIYTDLIDKLVMMLASDYLRNNSLSCLVQIAGLQIETDNQQQTNKFIMMLKAVTQELNNLIPLSNDDQTLQKMLKSIKKKNRNIFQIFSRGITNFYSQFFKAQYGWLQMAVYGNEQGIQICNAGFRYLLMMMKLDDDQVFKIAIEFFHFYIGKYLEDQKNPNPTKQNLSNSYLSNKNSLSGIYPQIFNEVMKIVSLKMAKPEEVLIVIDEDGVPTREEMENTQNASLYEIMKQLAVFLVKFDWNQMKKFIQSQIQKQNYENCFNFDTINSLSWVIGSLCGSVGQKQQKSFFITTLRTLLQLCEAKKGKQNKAVIASCIMYVVGQYPTFLRNNWTFLRTVIKKLFQFMKQDFPGIMEMACNAFLKISKSTCDQFVIVQQNEHQPYIKEIIRRIPEETKKLNSEALQMVFYEAVGHLISAQQNNQNLYEYIKQTLGYYLYEFQSIINNAQNNQNILKEEQVQKKIVFFMKLNEVIATGVGQPYLMMLQQMTDNFNKLYLYYSVEVNNSIMQNGKHMLNFMTIRLMRSVKKQILKVYLKFLQKCNNINPESSNYILNNIIMPLGSLLEDFKTSMPQTKQQQFVALFTVVLEKLYLVIDSPFLSNLLDMIFASSLPLITTDFNSFPEIRANFFAFLKSLIKHNFGLLYSLDQAHFDTILNCVVWSFRHQLSTYSDLGLDLLEQILNNVNKSPEIADLFYPKYHNRILRDVLDVMTDGYHKSGLDSQAKIFYLLIHVLTQNLVKNSITQNQQKSNAESLYDYLIQNLTAAFPNTNSNQIIQKINNWFQKLDEKEFKEEVEDFLVLINRYSPQEIMENKNQGQKTQSQISI